MGQSNGQISFESFNVTRNAQHVENQEWSDSMTRETPKTILSHVLEITWPTVEDSLREMSHSRWMNKKTKTRETKKKKDRMFIEGTSREGLVRRWFTRVDRWTSTMDASVPLVVTWWWWCWWWCYGRLCLAFHTRSTNRDERLHARRAGHVARSWPLSGLPCPFLSFPFLSFPLPLPFLAFPSLPFLRSLLSLSFRPFLKSSPRLMLPRDPAFATQHFLVFLLLLLGCFSVKNPPLFFVLAKMEYLDC